MARDALLREESCGCHFNEAYQTDENEALRSDDTCSYAAAWEYQGPRPSPPSIKSPCSSKTSNWRRGVTNEQDQDH